MAHQVHEVSGVFAVMDGEPGVECDLVGDVSQDPRADPVESPGPGQSVGEDSGFVAHDPAANAFDPAGHLVGGPSREGHQQNASGIGSVDDQVSDAMRQGVRLARACASDDQERTGRRRPARFDAMFDPAAAAGSRHRDRRRQPCGRNDSEQRSLHDLSFLFCSQRHPQMATGVVRSEISGPA